MFKLMQASLALDPPHLFLSLTLELSITPLVPAVLRIMFSCVFRRSECFPNGPETGHRGALGCSDDIRTTPELAIKRMHFNSLIPLLNKVSEWKNVRYVWLQKWCFWKFLSNAKCKLCFIWRQFTSYIAALCVFLLWELNSWTLALTAVELQYTTFFQVQRVRRVNLSNIWFSQKPAHPWTVHISISEALLCSYYWEPKPTGRRDADRLMAQSLTTRSICGTLKTEQVIPFQFSHNSTVSAKSQPSLARAFW